MFLHALCYSDWWPAAYSLHSVMFCGLSFDINPQATPFHHGYHYSLSFLPVFPEELVSVCHRFQVSWAALSRLSYSHNVAVLWPDTALVPPACFSGCVHLCLHMYRLPFSRTINTAENSSTLSHKSFCKIHSRRLYLTSDATAKCSYCPAVVERIFLGWQNVIYFLIWRKHRGFSFSGVWGFFFQIRVKCSAIA